jgi:hypothetical protein
MSGGKAQSPMLKEPTKTETLLTRSSLLLASGSWRIFVSWTISQKSSRSCASLKA